MKIYCVLFCENSHAGHLTAADPFLYHESAQAAMKAAYIIDGAGTYTWCIQERELDVQVAVEVQGGLVQNIYANADVCAEVYDLDLTDIQEEGGPTEGELRQAALAEETSKPGWRSIWC